MADNTALELADVIATLRQELKKAQDEGENKEIRFNVNNVEVELETVIEKAKGGEGGVKMRFLVLDMDAKANATYKNAIKQKIKLSLEMVNVTQNSDGTTATNKKPINDEIIDQNSNETTSSNAVQENEEV